MAKLKIILPGTPLRAATEDLVKTVYFNQYGARISTFPQLLVALVSNTGVPYCAAGLRIGLQDCFSEVYLDETVQSVFSRAMGETVSRGDILEVTGLASARMGASFTLLREIFMYGRDCNMRYGIFTITNRLRRTIKASHMPLVEFTPALRSRVSNPEDWGSYYDNDPWVCGIADTLMRRTRSRLVPAIRPPETRLLVA